ncbi:inorganic anion exchanger [Rhodotorula toruloides]|uniref:Inorganic anion exchanger n=1 Tax=Rhodotorula toruloides TaxID=5286 RepID=A0A511KP94_RHOTO|nr:inorganic anion exchanger [Rhodotorula toruloides]
MEGHTQPAASATPALASDSSPRPHPVATPREDIPATDWNDTARTVDSSSRTATRSPSIESTRKGGRGGGQRRERTFSPDRRPWPERSWAYELMPFRGMYNDVRRRLPFYVSDWTEGLRPKNWERVVGATIRMYFLNLMPCLAYIIDMYVRTDGTYGVNEGILASVIAALCFSLFSVQPLTIVGVTGLINLFNYTTFDILRGYDVNYIQFQAWVLIWAAIMHWISAVLNLCDFTRFITDMTSESFGLYVGIIYIQKGVELLVYEFDGGRGQAGWFSVVVAILFALSVYFVERAGTLHFGPFWARKALVDYTFAAAIIFYTGFVHIPGYIKSSDIQYLPISATFRPTLDRNWVVPFWDLPVKWVFVALPFGFLVTLLFYFDNNTSSVMAQSRGFPVKRPAGFHWDFFLLGCTTFVAGIIGLPAPNGLVPQAPVHTEALSVTKMVPAQAELSEGGFFEGDVKQAHRDADREVEKGRERKPLKLVRTRVVEQRISHFAMAMLTLGTMSRPLLVVLGLMSRAMFAGIFLVVGWGSVEGNGIVHKTLYLLRDRRMTPSSHPLFNIKKSSIVKFIAIQWLFFAAMIAVSETIAGIAFPIFPLALIPVRYYLVPRLFTPEELVALDAPTANSSAVLVSLGGPLQPEYGQPREKGGKNKDEEERVGGERRGRSSAWEDEEGRVEGLRRREALENEEQERGVPGGTAGLQRIVSIKR